MEKENNINGEIVENEKIDKEEFKKGIGILEIEDLIIIIKAEPLIKDEERKKSNK